MKKVILLSTFITSFVFCYSQPVVQRSTASNTALDQNLFTGRSFKVPVFDDTTSANVSVPTLDSAGKVIFTRDINWFWGRQTSPSRKWIPFNNSNPLTNATCGVASGTGVVTYDSLLIFDVSPATYVLCCDGIPRQTTQDSIRLPAADPSNPVYVSIILDSNGVNYVRGTPAANPSLPQLTDCQILLTTVLINAGDNVPANVSVNTIYDENYTTEWDSTRTVNMVADTANTSFPVHLLKDIDVTSNSLGGYIDFWTSTTINLNDYGVLKFYIREKGSAPIRLYLTWYLDDVQQTYSAVPLIVSGVTGVYQVMAVPTTAWRILNTASVNRLRITVVLGTQGFYLDWIQLQAGIIPTDIVGAGTVTSETAAGNTLFTPAIATPTTTPAWTFPLVNAPSYTVWGNSTNATGQPSYTQVDLSTSMITGLLPVTNLAIGNSGYILTMVGTTPTWTAASSGYDTTIVRTPLVALPGTVRDTLTLPISVGSATDSALFLNRGTGLLQMGKINGTLITAQNGLTDSSHYAILGGTLYKTTTINSVSWNLKVTGNPSVNAPIWGINTGSQAGVWADNTGTGYALAGVSIGAAAAFLERDVAANNTVTEIINIWGTVSGGTAIAGFGTKQSFKLEGSDGGIYTANELTSKWTTPTAGAQTSQFIINGVNAGTTGDILTLNGNKSIKANGYGSGTFTGTPTFTLQVDASGNIIEGSSSAVNIYNSNGALTGDRTLSGANHNLLMTGLGSTYFQSGSDITMESFSTSPDWANGASAISTKSSLYSNIGGTTSKINVEGVNGIMLIKDIFGVTTDLVLTFTQLPVYANDAAAGVGGLTIGMVYQTATGELRIKL